MKVIPNLLIASLLMTSALAPLPLISGKIEMPTDNSQEGKPATLKVLIGKQVDRVLLESKGGYHLYDPENHLLITSGSFSKRQWLTLEEGGLKWGELLPGIFQMRLVPATPEGSILIDGIEYKGCVEIYDVERKLYVINEVDVERYLKSTMTSQFAEEMDEEVMDAVAIVARTNAYFLASRKMNARWHVESGDVGYLGHALTLQNIHVDRAINNTRHMVLTYQGLPFAATWTKNCAGKTACFSSIYRKDSRSPKGVHSPFAARDREKFRWSFTISKKELAKALGTAGLVSFDLYQDGETQKTYGARVSQGGEFYQFDFFRLQQLLGSSRLKSNDFTVRIEQDLITFTGFGEGPGVGLCLFSANAMADKGDRATKILATFFPDTHLQNIRSFQNQ